MTSPCEDSPVYLELSLVTCQQQILPLLMHELSNLNPNHGSVVAFGIHLFPVPIIFTPSFKLCIIFDNLLHSETSKGERQEVASLLPSNQHNPLTFSKMQADFDDEFEEITDKLSRVILTGAILDIDEMLLEQQWKRLPGNGSDWEQALVKHKIELQQGLAGVKARLRRACEKDAMAMGVKEIPSIVVQEPDPDDDRKVADAIDGCTSSFYQEELEITKVLKTAPASSTQDQETSQDFNTLVSPSTITALAPLPVADCLPPSTPTADTTQEFASMMKDLLEPSTDDEQPNSTQVEIELKVEAKSTIELTAVEQSTRTEPNANRADETSITQPTAPPMVEPTERSSIEVARGHKRDSDEAGLDERATSDQTALAEQDKEVDNLPKKLKDTVESKMSEMAPPTLLPKTPAKGNALRADQKATPAAVRRSTRNL